MYNIYILYLSSEQRLRQRVSQEELQRSPPPPSHSPRGGTSFTVFESAAINTYLGRSVSLQKEINLERSSSSGAPSQEGIEKMWLVPAESDFQLRSQYDQWVCYIVSEMDAQALWIHRKHAALGHIYGDIPDAAKAAYAQYKRALFALALEIFCRKRYAYMLGGFFSALDILLVHCLNWAEAIDWSLDKISEELKEEEMEKKECLRLLGEYAERCRTRPAYARAREKKNMEKVME